MSIPTILNAWLAFMFLLCTVCGLTALVSALVAVVRERARGDAPRRRSRGGRVLTAVMGGLSVFGLLLLLVVFVPKFRDTFKEFEVMLPPLTEHVISASNLAVQWFWLMPVPVCGLVALFVLPAVLKGRWSLHVALWLSVVIVQMSILIALSLFMPLVRLISSLGGA